MNYPECVLELNSSVLFTPVISHQFTGYYFLLSNEAIAKLWNDAAALPKSNFLFLLWPPSAFPCIFDSTSASSWNDPQQSTSAISTRVFLKAFLKNWLLQQSWVVMKNNKKKVLLPQRARFDALMHVVNSVPGTSPLESAGGIVCTHRVKHLCKCLQGDGFKAH